VSSITTFLTLFTTDYWPRAAVLAASLQAAYGGEAELLALHVGDPPAEPFPDQPGLRTVELEELQLAALWDMAFRYEKGALANALKPFFITHVLERLGRPSAVFLDADTLVYERLDEVHERLDGAAAIILTPHVERPQHREREPLEIDLLRAGIMNGGFVAVSSAEPARRFLAWWSGHLLTDCRYDLERGYYGDQHWLALVPALFDGVHILRHRGYNAAYWNYPDRRPRLAEGRWRIDDDPLKFFHFSQWRLEQNETVRDCMRRLFWSQAPELEKLLSDYRERWRQATALLSPELRRPADPFGAFLDGSRIPRIVREAYARLNPSKAWPRDRLFGQGLALVMDRSSEAPVFAGVTLTELYAHIWQSRPDLRHHDPTTRKGQLGFLDWLVRHGAIDYGLPDEALEPARLSLAHQAEHPVRALLKSVADAHAELRDGAGTLATLSSRAGDVLRLFSGMLGEAEASIGPVENAAAFFRTVHRLGGRPGGREGVEDALREIEGHGRYLAEKKGFSYEAFVADIPAPPPDASGQPLRDPPAQAAAGPSAGDTMLEADAILNGCAVMAAAVERWAEQDERAAALSLLPASTRAPGQGALAGSPASLPAWACAPLGELAAIDPQLGAQLEGKAAATPVPPTRDPVARR